MKKDKLEQFFSDKLDGFEAPYSPEAWAKLDSKLSARSTGISLGAKIALFSAAAVIVAIVTYISLSEKTATTTPTLSETNKSEQKEIIENNSTETVDVQEKPSIQPEESTENVGHLDTQNSVQEVMPESTEVLTHKTQEATKPVIGNEQNESTTNPTLNRPEVADVKPIHILGHISSTLTCKGESITISNLGKDNEIVLLTANDKTVKLSNGKKTSIQINETTRIEFLNDKYQVMAAEVIQVLDNPQPNFDVDANIYAGGLPVAKFVSYGNYKDITWDFGNEQFGKGPEVSAHYFDKGTYEVKMTVTDINGCVGSEVKKIEIADKYNLLATNSIRLNDPNLETRTFMPFCLKERNAKFVLTIIDPKDNAVVFTTKDASKPWDGTDQRTGRILTTYKTFIWQVQLEDTLPGERGIYNGTVTIVE